MGFGIKSYVLMTGYWSNGMIVSSLMGFGITLFVNCKAEIF